MTDALALRDAAVVWHPFTQHATSGPPLGVLRGEGAWLTLDDGRRVLDAVSSWWVNLHGHGHPNIVEAIRAQAATLEHVIFAGFTHAPAVRLAERLVGLARRAGAPSTRAFYSDNGSTAVEVALKMAFQAAIQRGGTRCDRFLAVRGAYHGDTLGAMAVGEPEGFHPLFRTLLPKVDFVPTEDLDALDRLLAEHPGRHAAMIVEPMVQGASGMRFHSAAWLRGVFERCRAAGVTFIADEVFTGFGRTGPTFAFEHAGIAPDLICLSKGLTGGFLPLAVTLASDAIFEAFLYPDIERAFLHGHSYTANPVACAAALASLDLYEAPACVARRAEIARETAAHIHALDGQPGFRNARALGTLGAVELNVPATYGGADSVAIRAAALDLGVLLRPLGATLYALPPYCVSTDELAAIYAALTTLGRRGSRTSP
jgi:adenosylmethionine-8-amino-7-oxononanoate aminotransferase